MMTLITNTYDLICLTLSVLGMILIIFQLSKVDWDLEKLLFKEEK